MYAVLFDHINYNISGTCSYADILFLIDTSGSIDTSPGGEYDQMIQFITQIIFTLSETIDVQFASITFSTMATLEFGFGEFMTSDEVANAINATTHQGGYTNIADALKMARTKVFGKPGDRDDVGNVIILITNGVPTRNTEQTIAQADLVKHRGIRIMVVGIALDKNENVDIFYQISSHNYEVLRENDFQSLGYIIMNIEINMCGVESDVPFAGDGTFGKYCNT